MSKRKTEEDYRKLAEKQGFKWVGEVLPKNTTIKTEWECKKKHRWQTEYSKIQQGCGCPICSNSIKKTEKDYYKLAKKRDFKWIGKKLPKNTHIKTLWKCKKRHVWLATYHKISDGSGCSYCFNETRRLLKKDYYNLAKSKDFKWVDGVLPKNTHIKVEWECEKKHRWKATYSDINQGSDCPYCSRKAKKTTKDYHNLAKLKGFKFIDVLPKNIFIPVKWECSKGHVWKACYGNIYSGTTCPYCQNRVNGYLVSKPQIKLNNMLTGYLNYPEAKYHIDVAIMRYSQKIAVEYDGQYWHNRNKEHDIIRDKFLISNGWKVLHIKSGNLLPTRKKLNIAIKHLLETNDSTCNLYLRDWKH